MLASVLILALFLFLWFAMESKGADHAWKLTPDEIAELEEYLSAIPDTDK